MADPLQRELSIVAYLQDAFVTGAHTDLELRVVRGLLCAGVARSGGARGSPRWVRAHRSPGATGGL